MRTETIQYESGVPKFEVPWQGAVFAAILIACVFLGMALSRRKKQAFGRLASFIQGQAGGSAFFRNFSFSGVYKTRPLAIKNEPGGRNSPDLLAVTFEGPLFILDLNVSEEGFLKETLEKLGMMKDVDTGDPVFDARFHAASEVDDLARKYLANPEIRRRITALFDGGAVSLELVPCGAALPGLIRFKKRYSDVEEDLSGEKLLPLLDALDFLCSEKNGKEFFRKPDVAEKL